MKSVNGRFGCIISTFVLDAEMTKLAARVRLPKKRYQMVWDIGHKLQAQIARPIIHYSLAAGTWQPQGNVTQHINSIYNNSRIEDVWLER
jgi:hypothetical protein